MNCVSCGSPEVDRVGGTSTCQKCGKSFVPSHFKLLGFVQQRVGNMSVELINTFLEVFAEELDVRRIHSDKVKGIETTHVHVPRRMISGPPFMTSTDGFCTVKFADGLLTIIHQEGGGVEPGERGFEFDPLHFIQEFGPMMLQGGYKSLSGEFSVNLGTSPFSTPPSFLEIKIHDLAPIWVSASDFHKFLKDLKSIYVNSD